MKKPTPSPDPASLRSRAEQRLQAQKPETRVQDGDDETLRLVHELQVHLVEVELQNEELQNARDALEAGLEKYSDLYDFAPVGYLTLERDGTIREANLAAATLLGTERSRLVPRRFGSCVSGVDRAAVIVFLARVFETQVQESCEVNLVREKMPAIEVRIAAMASASGRECRAVIQDITEQKRAEQDRLVLNKLESTGILASGIAHDFNNLLAIIVLNLEIAKSLIPPGKELEQRLNDAKETALLASGLTQQLITFSKGGAPVLKLTSLNHVIQKSVRSALSGSRMDCEFQLAEDLWPAEVDEAQIGQVIRNLALNAREAMVKGGVLDVGAENVVLTSNQRPSLPPGDYIMIKVSDHGCGIAKELLPKVFDPYYSTKQMGVQKGMGLGLAICHTVMKKHHGAIAVESDVGVGTTVTMHLPASRNSLKPQKKSPPSALDRKGRILVMDDEPGVREMVGLSLKRMGHEIELAEDGAAAIDAYKRMRQQGRPFDAVLLDLTVRDGVGGLDTIRELLKIDPNVKAIVMSGYADDPAVLQPGRYGFKSVLAKPFDQDTLREILLHVLGAENSLQPPVIRHSGVRGGRSARG